MTSYSERFQAFKNALSKNVPDLQVKYKNESFLMKLLGMIMFFNPSFMTNFITTIGNTVYFPTKEMVEEDNSSAIRVLAHEYVHMRDSQRYSNFIFVIMYLFPQILAPLALLLLLVWWPLAIVGFLLLLAPLPAPGRKLLELNGYRMSLFMTNYFLEEDGFSLGERENILKSYVDPLNNHFTSFNYYVMWPFGVKEELSAAAQDVLSGEILKKDVIYSEVEEALASSK